MLFARIKTMLVVSLFLSLIACSQNGVYQFTDEFRNQKISSTRKMLVSNFLDSELEMQIQQIIDLENQSPEYQLKLFYKGKASQRPQFRSGDSLIVLLNQKKRMKFSSQVGAEGVKVVERNVIFDNVEKENVTYANLELTDIENIANSHTVSLKAEGENSDVRGSLSQSQILHLRQFLATVKDKLSST